MDKRLSFWGILPIFRAPFLSQITYGDHYNRMVSLSDYFSEFKPPSERALLSEWFEFFYSLLRDKYRCEYIYKNTLANELYLTDRHERPNSFFTNEFRCGLSRVDVAIFNGTSTAYEVKSKYDSLARLASQINDYKKIFDKIVVVTHDEKVDSVLKEIDSFVGVMMLDPQGKIHDIREAESNKENTDTGAIFDCMWQSEYRSVLKDKFGFAPNVPNSRMYRASKKLFHQLEPAEAHDAMVGEIRRRGKLRPFAELIDDVPSSLKHACLSVSRPKGLAPQIIKKLGEPLAP